MNTEHDLSNSEAVLDNAAKQAKMALRALDKVDGKTLESWVQYGEALNEGRALFASNDEFGKWIKANQLDIIAKRGDKRIRTNPHERSASMWAAANPEQFDLMKTRHPGVVTARGLHAKWKGHVNEVAANYALADIADTEEMMVELDKVATQTGLSINELAEATDKQKRKESQAADKAAKEAALRAAQVDALRAEVEEEVKASLGVEPAVDTTLVQTVQVILMHATIGTINAALAQSEAPKLKTAGDPSHPFWVAGIARSKDAYVQAISDLNGVVSGDALTDEIMDMIAALALKGSILPGEMNPPAGFALGDGFAGNVMGAVRLTQSQVEAA